MRQVLPPPTTYPIPSSALRGHWYLCHAALHHGSRLRSGRAWLRPGPGATAERWLLSTRAAGGVLGPLGVGSGDELARVVTVRLAEGCYRCHWKGKSDMELSK